MLPQGTSLGNGFSSTIGINRWAALVAQWCVAHVPTFKDLAASQPEPEPNRSSTQPSKNRALTDFLDHLGVF